MHLVHCQPVSHCLKRVAPDACRRAAAAAAAALAPGCVLPVLVLAFWLSPLNGLGPMWKRRRTALNTLRSLWFTVTYVSPARTPDRCPRKDAWGEMNCM